MSSWLKLAAVVADAVGACFNAADDIGGWESALRSTSGCSTGRSWCADGRLGARLLCSRPAVLCVCRRFLAAASHEAEAETKGGECMDVWGPFC